ncbi:glycoside hydrolase family 38 C-terminal domain-containing protein [Lederbergia ruris]|uniref:Alpha-mannosidase n=1 Tax=Lederbergia ruris TaxID=217495 RepID=A0ABQ4KPA3_9BACI|nr:glycoside hydrolase family 38 C-terminal domain-containing protein [Lederbergia ruris]GIN59765.1 alpha-mannosidase [Lederbergia ruris]
MKTELRNTNIQDTHNSGNVIRFSAENSIFFVKQEDVLKQVIFVHIELDERISNADLILTSKYGKTVERVGRIGSGKSTFELYVPEVKEPTSYRVILRWDSNEIGDSVTVLPEKHWTIHIVQHSHLDIGYTDPQYEVLDHHLLYLDQVLELCDADKEDPDTNFKWVIEVTWPLKYWLKSRPKRQVEKMLGRIKEGRIEVAGAYMSMHTEAYHIDELARTFETAQQLRDEYGIKIDTVLQTDVPGHTKGFLKCLTQMDIKYFSVAHNYAGRSIPHLLPGEKLQRPFYWQQEDGQKVLVWYTDTPHGVYMEGNRLGIADGYKETFQKLPELFQQLKEENYPLDTLHLRVQGSYWDNAGPSITPSMVAKQWNAKWAFPKLITSTNKQFFETIESKENISIPTFKGDWSDWWADGIGQGAYANGINRRSHHLLRSAETFHSIAAMHDNHYVYPKEGLQKAFENMVLFDEHTWGAWNPWDKTLSNNTSGEIQWNIKKGFALNAYNLSLTEYRRAQNLLINSLECEYDKKSSTIVVYNPESFMRTDKVTVFIPLGKIDVRKPFTIIDQDNGERIPFSTDLRIESTPKPRGAFVTFISEDIPSLGFKTYNIFEIAEKEEQNEDLINKESNVLENNFYKIVFDQETGGITSIMDKEINQEIVNSKSSFQLNQYVYDRYTTAPRFNHLSSRVTGDSNTLGKRSTASLAKVEQVKSNSVYQKMKITLHAPGCEWIVQEVTLYKNLKRIDIVNRLMKTETEEKEAVYIPFPFKVAGGKVRYETTGDYVSPNDPHVPGSCHYMKAIQHWLSVSNSDYTVLWGTMEAPLIQLENIHIPYAPFEKTLPLNEAQTIYSYALHNIWDTNFPNKQGGEIEFHYSISSHSGAFKPIEAYKFGTQVQNPISGITVPYKIQNKGDSFVTCDRNNIQILNIRKLEGNRFSIRIQEISGKDTIVTLGFGQVKIDSAYTSNIANGNLLKIKNNEANVTAKVNKNDIQTIIIDIRND